MAFVASITTGNELLVFVGVRICLFDLAGVGPAPGAEREGRFGKGEAAYIYRQSLLTVSYAMLSPCRSSRDRIIMPDADVKAT